MIGLRYVPGQIVVLSRSSIESDFDESYLSAFSEAQASKSYELNSGSYNLGLYVVGEGEELRFLDYVSNQPTTVSTSLNYIGSGLDDRIVNDDLHQELAYTPGAPVPRNFQYFFMNRNHENIENYLHDQYEELLNSYNYNQSDFLIGAIDVTQNHCIDVMRSILNGLIQRLSIESSSNRFSIVGLTANLDNSDITDLFGFSDRLLQLADFSHKVSTPLIAINLSVDFSQIIRGYTITDAASAESPNTVYSFPFFEKTLSKVINDARLGRIKNLHPALFVAAGNRLESNALPRVRLGYPAVRPEAMATTFVTVDLQNHLADPVDSVDIPATTGLKPCFGVDIQQWRPHRVNGSSFASAWLAGYYAGLVHNQNDVLKMGMFSKLAWLMQHTERYELPKGAGRLPCHAAVIRQSRNQPYLSTHVDLLINELRNEFNADFCLHGSTAAVTEWLRLNGKDISDLAPWINKDLGDIDLLFAGRITAPKDKVVTIQDIKKFVHDWIKTHLNRSWVMDRKRLVQIHSYEGTVNKTSRLRSVTPVNHLYVTQGGVIDTWGGLQDLQQGHIRFLPMTHGAFWERNNRYGSGSDSLGLNILHWLSIISLLRLVSYSVGISPPVPHYESQQKILDILQTAQADPIGYKIFGHTLNDVRERLDRRFERVETLMASCMRKNILDPSLDNILDTLSVMRHSVINHGTY